MAKTSLVTGITGMDSVELSKILLNKGYKVYGMARQCSSRSFWRLEEAGILNDIEIVQGDLNDQQSLNHIISNIKPDECYNLAAISYVGSSWVTPELMMNVTGAGPIRVMEAIKDFSPQTKLYQASSSECYGVVKEIPQSINTPFNPASIYGVAKCSAHYALNVYRRSYNLFAVGGILFNHSGIYRGPEFLERKVTIAVARIKAGLQSDLHLGNLLAKRDFGASSDYMNAAWMMLQQDKPKDYVIGSGDTHTVEEVCEVAFSHVNLNYKDYVVQDPKFFRPSEVDILLADSNEARKELNWEPTVSFKELITTMVDRDIERVKIGKL